VDATSANNRIKGLGDDHRSAAGSLRYMPGGEPVLTPAGDPLVDAKGRPSYVTSAGSGPSVGKHLLMAYLPAGHARHGTGWRWSTWPSCTR
jgi:glycine cleavage system aminomethyltransferase T